MANTESAKKQMRSNERRRLRNRLHAGRARTEVRKARQAIAAGDVEAAALAVSSASKWLDHAASRGSIHRNNASRRKGRLMAQLAQLRAMPARPAPVEPPAAEPEKPRRAKKAEAKPKAEKPARAEKKPKEDKKAKAEAKPKAEKKPRTKKADAE